MHLFFRVFAMKLSLIPRLWIVISHCALIAAAEKFQIATTLVPGIGSLSSSEDPRARVRVLKNDYETLRNGGGIDLLAESRQLLLMKNRQMHNDLRMVQRKQLLQRIHGLYAVNPYYANVANKVIASFIMGGVFNRIGNTRPVCCLSCAGHSMVIKHIKSFPRKWKSCSFAQTSHFAVCIPENSCIVHLINIQKDKFVERCEIDLPAKEPVCLEGSIPGVILLTSSNDVWLWNGNDTLHVNENYSSQLLKALPLGTLNVEKQDDDILHVYHRDSYGAEGEIKCQMATAEENGKYGIFLGPQRTRCLLVYKNFVKMYDSATRSIRTFSLNTSEFERQYPVHSGAIPVQGDHMLLWGNNAFYWYTYDESGNIAYSTRRYIAGGILEVVLNEQGDIMATLPREFRAPIISYVQGKARQPKPDILLPAWNQGVDHIRLKDYRFLFHCVDGTSWMFDIPDIVAVVEQLKTREADLCDSLWKVYSWFASYKKGARITAIKKIYLDADQTKIWNGIPVKLRTRFMCNTEDVMRIRAVTGKPA